MKNNAASGLTALDIINPNAKITGWLHALSTSGAISQETLKAGTSHFGLKRSPAGWVLFLQRIFVLLGVILFVSGLIFFMAWNWESLSRFAKFATLESVFILFGAYSLLRWPQKGNRGEGWDARIALLGAAIVTGGMLALYGQVYQTGADAWELFRAWTVMLVIFAFPGRATVFWFMAWLVGSAWLTLYMRYTFAPRWNAEFFLLIMALAQFAMLAINEAAAHFLKKYGCACDRGRWLSRIIGCAAIMIMGAYAVYSIAFDITWNYGQQHSFFAGGGVALYAASLALVFVVYYKFIPELLLLSLSIFSATTVACVTISRTILENSHFEAWVFLVIGLMVLGLAFGSLKLILILRKNIQGRAKKELSETTDEAAHSMGIFKNRAGRQAELKAWLIERGAATAEDIDACYSAEEAAQELESPWYAKLFARLGIWIGSAVALTAFTFLVFDGLNSSQALGLIGLLLCGLSVHLGHGNKLAGRALSQVLGVCGLLYATCLFEFEKDPTAIVLAVLFVLFWLLKPPFAARMGAFAGMLTCIFVFLGVYYYRSYGIGPAFYVKTAIYCLGLLWAAHFFVVMDGRSPAWRRQPGGEWLRQRFCLSDVLSSSAYACLIFFAVLALSGSDPVTVIVTPLSILDFKIGTAAVFIALTGLFIWRYPTLRAQALIIGLPLIAIAWFAHYLALGFGLLLLSFHTGKNAFLATATAYLGFGVYCYYYNLDVSLLYKSIVLMGTGVFFLALGILLARPFIKERLQ